MEELNKETGETIHLGVLNDDSLIYVAKLESTQAVRIISRIGKTAPLYCTGLGKAMLAIFSDEELERYLAKTRFEKYTAVLLSRFRPTENCAGPLA
ncbi:IclR family transcriptional regulator domain-containing protein [Thermosinus carboxydivorans]|uniref:IclR family transcriptional regulator domain-containing protein n=1 Tax=Thermosinus carboxydivorans TaxID=261685 RepID=UPI0002EB4BD5|nr:IclR family transcriptional regulator C-terminal domain-containing protein [Thermosinus carboxydivorans]